MEDKTEPESVWARMAAGLDSREDSLSILCCSIQSMGLISTSYKHRLESFLETMESVTGAFMQCGIKRFTSYYLQVQGMTLGLAEKGA